MPNNIAQCPRSGLHPETAQFISLKCFSPKHLSKIIINENHFNDHFLLYLPEN